MAKKLKGEIFLLSANDLFSGNVVFYSKDGWSKSSEKALKININKLDSFDKIVEQDEKDCLIVSPVFVELDELGNIKKLRDKIRQNGLTIELK